MASLAHDLKHVLAVALRRPDSDTDLLGRFAASRDEVAFAELVRHHGPAVLRVCRSLLPRADADDAFQATFFVLAKRAESLGDVQSLGGWLVGVAGRVARQLRKAGWRRVEVEKGHRLHEAAGPEQDQNTRELNEELTRLPDRLRNPIVLCYLEAKTQDEAAAELGQSVRTLRRRIEKAKYVLRLRLERRGVALAVLAVSAPLWIPSDAAARTAANAVQFLAGGVRSPAAILAKGIGMGSLLKLKVVAGLCVVAGALTAVGVAQEGPKPGPLPQSERSGAQPVALPAAAVRFSGIIDFPEDNQGMGITVRDESFPIQVMASNQAVARVVYHEAKYQYESLSKLWFGTPRKPSVDVSIRVILKADSDRKTVMQFDSDGKLTGAEVTLYGALEPMLYDQLPCEITQVVLRSRFGPKLPRWVADGIARTVTSPDYLAWNDAAIREFISAGKAYRLKTLLAMNEYPEAREDRRLFVSESTSIVRFLESATPSRTPPGMRRIPYLNRLFVSDKDPTKELIRFAELGMKGDWNVALKEVYGFDSIEATEEAWLKWLSSPASRDGLPENTPTLPPPVAPEPARIPPVKVGK